MAEVQKAGGVEVGPEKVCTPAKLLTFIERRLAGADLARRTLKIAGMQPSSEAADRERIFREARARAVDDGCTPVPPHDVQDLEALRLWCATWKPAPPPLEPLTERQGTVYKVIVEASNQGRRLTGKEITKLTGIDQSTLTKEIIPKLKRLRGIANKPGAGYFIPQRTP